MQTILKKFDSTLKFDVSSSVATSTNGLLAFSIFVLFALESLSLLTSISQTGLIWFGSPKSSTRIFGYETRIQSHYSRSHIILESSQWVVGKKPNSWMTGQNSVMSTTTTKIFLPCEYLNKLLKSEWTSLFEIRNDEKDESSVYNYHLPFRLIKIYWETSKWFPTN